MNVAMEVGGKVHYQSVTNRSHYPERAFAFKFKDFAATIFGHSDAVYKLVIEIRHFCI